MPSARYSCHSILERFSRGFVPAARLTDALNDLRMAPVLPSPCDLHRSVEAEQEQDVVLDLRAGTLEDVEIDRDLRPMGRYVRRADHRSGLQLRGGVYVRGKKS